MRTVLLAVAVCVACLGRPLEAASGGRLLRRVRRGWMWNQFFLQEEYTGSERQYIGKVGTRVGEGGAHKETQVPGSTRPLTPPVWKHFSRV